MKKLIIDNREIVTNLGSNYSFGNGNSTATMSVRIKRDSRETDREFVERLAKAGYTHITLKLSTTSVRGYYETYALVKK